MTQKLTTLTSSLRCTHKLPSSATEQPTVRTRDLLSRSPSTKMLPALSPHETPTKASLKVPSLSNQYTLSLSGVSNVLPSKTDRSQGRSSLSLCPADHQAFVPKGMENAANLVGFSDERSTTEVSEISDMPSLRPSFTRWKSADSLCPSPPAQRPSKKSFSEVHQNDIDDSRGTDVARWQNSSSMCRPSQLVRPSRRVSISDDKDKPLPTSEIEPVRWESSEPLSSSPHRPERRSSLTPSQAIQDPASVQLTPARRIEAPAMTRTASIRPRLSRNNTLAEMHKTLSSSYLNKPESELETHLMAMKVSAPARIETVSGYGRKPPARACSERLSWTSGQPSLPLLQNDPLRAKLEGGLRRKAPARSASERVSCLSIQRAARQSRGSAVPLEAPEKSQGQTKRSTSASEMVPRRRKLAGSDVAKQRLLKRALLRSVSHEAISFASAARSTSSIEEHMPVVATSTTTMSLAGCGADDSSYALSLSEANDYSAEHRAGLPPNEVTASSQKLMSKQSSFASSVSIESRRSDSAMSTASARCA